MEILTVNSFTDYYAKIRARTRRVVDCIPPERFDWRYQDEKFSFADMIRHVAAIERYMFAENARRGQWTYPGHGPDLAESPADVIRFFERMHQESMEIFRSLADDDLNLKTTTPMGAPITVWKWLRAMIEHEVHHRGQLYIMLGMIGVTTPPLYGLTSEQVRERGAR